MGGVGELGGSRGSWRRRLTSSAGSERARQRRWRRCGGTLRMHLQAGTHLLRCNLLMIMPCAIPLCAPFLSLSFPSNFRSYSVSFFLSFLSSTSFLPQTLLRPDIFFASCRNFRLLRAIAPATNTSNALESSRLCEELYTRCHARARACAPTLRKPRSPTFYQI